MVSKGSDSVDFVIANLVKAGDNVITQDYGLVAMWLIVLINQDAMICTDENFGGLLKQCNISQNTAFGLILNY